MNSVSCAQMTDQQRGFLTNQIAQGQNTLPSLRFKCSRKDRQGLMRERGFRVIMIHGFRSGMRKAMIITIIKIFFFILERKRWGRGSILSIPMHCKKISPPCMICKQRHHRQEGFQLSFCLLSSKHFQKSQ